ncbi:hypothetical protein HC256_010322 [Beauveria bassiana]|nr:hypothetical protein HC256_010322 [Beauveria bassiana]
MCFLYMLYYSFVSYRQQLGWKSAKASAVPHSYTRLEVPGYGSMLLSDSDSVSTFEFEAPEHEYNSDQSVAVSNKTNLVSTANPGLAVECDSGRVTRGSTHGLNVEPILF